MIHCCYSTEHVRYILPNACTCVHSRCVAGGARTAAAPADDDRGPVTGRSLGFVRRDAEGEVLRRCADEPARAGEQVVEELRRDREELGAGVDVGLGEVARVDDAGLGRPFRDARLGERLLQLLHLP